MHVYVYERTCVSTNCYMASTYACVCIRTYMRKYSGTYVCYGQKRGLGRRTEVSNDDGGFKTEAWDKRRRR